MRRQGRRIAMLAFGTMVAPALAAGEALDATVVNMRFVKPLDVALLRELARTHEAFVTVEEHVRDGRRRQRRSPRRWRRQASCAPLLHLGLPDRFIDHGEQAQLLAMEGLDAKGIEGSVRQRFADLLNGGGPRLVSNRSA